MTEISIIEGKFRDGEDSFFLTALIQDGAINGPVLCYFRWMRYMQGLSQKTLLRHAHGLKRFCQYWSLHNGRLKGDDFLRAYFEALVMGDLALGWAPLRRKTAIDYFEAINLFADWLTDQGKQFLSTDRPHPNPLTEYRAGWYEQLAVFQRRIKTDMLVHLFPRTKQGRGIRLIRRVNPTRLNARGRSVLENGRGQRKAMVFEEFNRLLNHEKDIRDLLLWLLLGAAGLRVSEALHLFCSDVSVNGREAKVVIAHPSDGLIETTDVRGRPVKLKRSVYLKEQYNRVPRDYFPLSDMQHAGWKGLAIEDGENLWSYVTWLLPMYGVLFWKAHCLYMRVRNRIVADAHPYYFINLKRNIGSPLTRSNVTSILYSRTKSCCIDGPRNPHALRHMYAYTMENYFNIPSHAVQRAIHHVSPNSTKIYTALETDKLRILLEDAQSRLFSTENSWPNPSALLT